MTKLLHVMCHQHVEKVADIKKGQHRGSDNSTTRRTPKHQIHGGKILPQPTRLKLQTVLKVHRDYMKESCEI